MKFDIDELLHVIAVIHWKTIGNEVGQACTIPVLYNGYIGITVEFSNITLVLKSCKLKLIEYVDYRIHWYCHIFKK